jgi:hypothetical protein
MFRRALSYLFLLSCFLALPGCDTGSLVKPPVTQDQLTAIPAGASIAWIEIEGQMQKALVQNDPTGRWSVNGVTVKVIMVLDYPCGFIGPLPEGHGRDCTDDPDGTPSDEPPTARYLGDPTDTFDAMIGDPDTPEAGDADGSDQWELINLGDPTADEGPLKN